MNCPRLFYYKTILGLSTPPTEATIKGNLAHAVYERVFDLPAADRTAQLATQMIRPEWDNMLNGNVDLRSSVQDIQAVIPPGSETEIRMLADVEKLVTNWFLMERVQNFDPTQLTLPDGTQVDGREVHVEAKLGDVNVHGFVDRVDQWTADGHTTYSVTDYKTGKVPRPQYRNKYWFQLRLYGAAIHHMWKATPGVLRLVFTASGDRDAGILTMPFNSREVEKVQVEVASLWEKMVNAFNKDEWPTRKGPLCNWCYFQNICPAWNPEMADVPVDGAIS